MTIPIIVTVIGTLGTGGLIGVVLTHKRESKKQKDTSSYGLITALSARLNEVEEDLKEQREWRRAQETRYSVLWAYARRLIDYAYRHRKEDSPDPPPMPDELK